MPHLSIGIFGITVADEEGLFERGVIVTHDARRSSARPAKAGPTLLRHRSTSGRGHNDDQHHDRADQDIRPFPRGESRSLQLIQVLRELTQILGRKLRDALIDLLLREAAGGQRLRDLIAGDDLANQREIRRARIKALIGDGLRRRRRGERGNRSESDNDEEND